MGEFIVLISRVSLLAGLGVFAWLFIKGERPQLYFYIDTAVFLLGLYYIISFCLRMLRLIKLAMAAFF